MKIFQTGRKNIISYSLLLFTGVIISLFSFFYFHERVTSGEYKKDLMEKLLALRGSERQELLKESKDEITPEFINKVLLEANEYCNDKESLERGKGLLELAMEVSDFTGDKISNGKSCLFYEGLYYLEHKDKTYPYYNKALELFKETGCRRGEASCYLFKGMVAINMNNKDEAVTYLQKCIEIYEEIGSKKDRGTVLGVLGTFYSSLDEREKALDYYTDSLKAFDESGCYMKKVLIYHYIASSMASEGKLDEALENLEQGETLLNSITDEEIGKEKDEREPYYPNKEEMDRYYDRDLSFLDNLIAKGKIYYQWGRYEDAMKTYRKELELAKKTGNNREEITGLFQMGSIYSKLGKKEKAVEYYEESLKIDCEGLNNTIKCINYYMLAMYYLDAFDNMDTCLESFNNGIRQTEKIEFLPLREIMKSVGFKMMGYAYLEKEKPDEAEESFKKALPVFEAYQKDFGKQETHMAEIYLALGVISSKKNKREEALSYYGKAMKISEDYFLTRSIMDCYEDMAEFYEGEEDHRSAVENYKKALDISRTINIPARTWKLLFSMGSVCEKMGDLQNASYCYKSSIDIIERMRQDIKVEDFKRDFMKDKIEAYEKMINLLVRMKNDKEAFNYSERARSRAFLDILSNNKVDFSHGIPPELIKREEELTRKIQILNSRMGEEKEKPPAEQRKDVIEKLIRELDVLKKDYEELLEEIKLKHPEYASLISVYPDKAEDIQSLLPDDTLLFEYFTGKEKTFLWILSNKDIRTFVLDVKRDELGAEIKKYREEIGSMTLEKIKSDSWKEEGRKLYSLLFKGDEKFMRDKKQIVIVPDGIMNYLPFQTLMDGEGKLLVEKFTILYLPSGSVLKYCREKNTMSDKSLIAFTPGSFTQGGYSPLPYSKEEVEKISEFYEDREIYSEDKMTIDKVFERGSKYDILHFATHSVLDTEAPLFSSLIFADGPLELYRIFGLDLHAYLVTLSACSTGLGELVAGDELLGLSRAFIYAGTPSVCVSLWNVSDVSTADLMKRFYYYLKEGKSKSEALRFAQIDTMKQYPHPFFWAPFVLIGDWR